jgi:CDP-glucose 4,6-dehydratase
MVSFWNRKKVFITGHTGFKGGWLSLILQHYGAKVTGYSLDPPTTPNLFGITNLNSRITSCINDIRDLTSLKRELKISSPEIVFHLAAQPIVLESYKNPLETYTTNVIGTLNLLEAIRSVPSVRAVVIITTDKCYENREWIWPYRESDVLGGFDPYSSSKACAEIVTASMRKSFFNPELDPENNIWIATARAGNVIGGGDWGADRLIPDFIRAILKNEKIVIRNPTAIRPWQHVFEPLSGYMVLAQKLFSEGAPFAEAWNFGPDPSDAQTVEWIITKLYELWGSEPVYDILPQKQLHEAHWLRLDCSKARNALKWQPKWNLEKALKMIVEWVSVYKKQEDVYRLSVNQIEQYFTEQE